MVEIIFDDKFKQVFSRIKDQLLKERIIKQLEKIKTNPEFGKPMRYSRKGTREVYIGTFRLSYSYDEEKEILELLDFYHKDEQ